MQLDNLTKPRYLLWVCALIFGLGLLTLTGDWRASPDSIFYLCTSWSLAHGEGYVFLGQPFVKYPPGFALFLAPAIRAWGFHFYLLHAHLWLCAVTGLFFLGLWARRQWGPNHAAMVVILVGFNYFFWSWSTNFLISESLFFALTMLALWLSERWRRRPSVRWSLLLGAVLLAALSVRLAGLALAPALAAVHLFGRPRRDRRRWVATAALAGAFAAALVAWFVYVRVHAVPGADHYLREWRLIAASQQYDATAPGSLPAWVAHLLRHNWTAHSRNILWVMTGSPYLPTGWRAPAALVLALTLLGVVHGLVRRRTMADYYLAAYIALHFLWPYDEKTRFWMPVLPLLMLAFVQGVRVVGVAAQAGGAGRRRVRAAVLLGAWLVCAPSVLRALTSAPAEYAGLSALYVRTVGAMLAAGYLAAGLWLVRRLAVPGAAAGAWPAHRAAVTVAVLCALNVGAIAYRTHLKHQRHALKTNDVLWAHVHGAWLRANTTPETVVACTRKDVIIGVYGDRRTAVLAAHADRLPAKARFVVGPVEDGPDAHPALRREQRRLCPVCRYGKRVLYRVDRTPVHAVQPAAPPRRMTDRVSGPNTVLRSLSRPLGRHAQTSLGAAPDSRRDAPWLNGIAFGRRFRAGSVRRNRGSCARPVRTRRSPGLTRTWLRTCSRQPAPTAWSGSCPRSTCPGNAGGRGSAGPW